MRSGRREGSGVAETAEGRVHLFLAGLNIFTVASLVCGLATSQEMLIVTRGVQGLGAAIISPTALAIIPVTFREGPERSRALAVWGSIVGAGSATGLLLGGNLTEYAGWQWIFFVNVPVGLLVALTHGYPAALLVSSLFALAGIIVAFALIRVDRSRIEGASAAPPAA